MKLLQKGLDTEKYIIDYLDNVAEDRKSERTDRDFLSSYYMWRVPNGPMIPARNKKADKNLNFDDYKKFMQ